MKYLNTTELRADAQNADQHDYHIYAATIRQCANEIDALRAVLRELETYALVQAIGVRGGACPHAYAKKKTICNISTVSKKKANCDEADANMRLIAAAPDLLAACERMVAFLVQGPTGRPGDSASEQAQMIHQAEAAIHKSRPH